MEEEDILNEILLQDDDMKLTPLAGRSVLSPMLLDDDILNSDEERAILAINDVPSNSSTSRSSLSQRKTQPQTSLASSRTSDDSFGKRSGPVEAYTEDLSVNYGGKIKSYETKRAQNALRTNFAYGRGSHSSKTVERPFSTFGYSSNINRRPENEENEMNDDDQHSRSSYILSSAHRHRLGSPVHRRLGQIHNYPRSTRIERKLQEVAQMNANTLSDYTKMIRLTPDSYSNVYDNTPSPLHMRRVMLRRGTGYDDTTPISEPSTPFIIGENNSRVVVQKDPKAMMPDEDEVCSPKYPIQYPIVQRKLPIHQRLGIGYEEPFTAEKEPPSPDIRYFVLKTASLNNIVLSQQKGVWVTIRNNYRMFKRVYKNTKRVVCFVTHNDANGFEGYCEIDSHVEKYMVKDQFKGGKFDVHWLHTQPLSFRRCDDVMNPWDNYKQLERSVDGQELPKNIGERLLELYEEIDELFNNEQYMIKQLVDDDDIYEVSKYHKAEKSRRARAPLLRINRGFVPPKIISWEEDPKLAETGYESYFSSSVESYDEDSSAESSATYNDGKSHSRASVFTRVREPIRLL